MPPVRTERVERARLLDRLDSALRPGVRLALISAPAGFGKTSLLVEWLERCKAFQEGKSAAWYALDAGDNHLDSFLSYLTASINRARPGTIPETLALLRASLSGAEAPRSDIILASLVNELAGLDPSQPFIIALDDLQFVTTLDVREAVSFLVENLPPAVRLAIATRSDPPLPLPRLRARGQMVELRAADLRFTADEAAQFLIQGLGIHLDQGAAKELVASLTERTEGWAAGLQMAGLALQTGDRDPAELIRTFSGSHRYVLDYLVEEVLARLPEDLVDFLLQTSVLDRFCASLCQAVVGGLGMPAAGPVDSGEKRDNESASLLNKQHVYRDQGLLTNTLDFLDQSNLFLIPLDSERRWFRYHHLFADLLRARLKQVKPGLESTLHRRASAWFEQNGAIAESIQHALAAPDYDQAARLVEKHCIALFRRGELHSLQKWVSMLPEELSARRPMLCIYRAWVVVFAGQLEGIEALLQQAESFLPDLDEAERSEIQGNCAAMRCHRLIITGKMAEGLALVQVVEENLPDRTAWVRGFIEWSQGYAHRLMGHLDQAAICFERCFQQGKAENDPWGTAMNGIDLGLVRRQQGRLREAGKIFQSALETVEQCGARKLGYTGRLLTALAAVQYDQNDLVSAQRSLEEAVALNQSWRNPNHLVYSYMNLARVYTAMGNFSAAEGMLQACGPVLRDWPVLPLLGRAVETAWINLRLARWKSPSLPSGNGPFLADLALQGLIQAVLAAAQPGLPFDEAREAQQSLAARVLIAQGRVEEVLRLLEVMEEAARAGGRIIMLIEVLAFKALALDQLGQAEKALEAAGEAVTRAVEAGALRPVIDTAQATGTGALKKLLTGLQKAGSLSPEALDPFLAALADVEPSPAVQQPGAASQKPDPAASPALVEPLTAREMEVMRLLAQGLTNAQIAERLVVTTGTVKAHTASIFRKLDAENRTQAVAKARALGILEA